MHDPQHIGGEHQKPCGERPTPPPAPPKPKSADASALIEVMHRLIASNAAQTEATKQLDRHVCTIANDHLCKLLKGITDMKDTITHLNGTIASAVTLIGDQATEIATLKSQIATAGQADDTDIADADKTLADAVAAQTPTPIAVDPVTGKPIPPTE